MKYSIVLITTFTLFTLISCNQVIQDSEKTKQVPALPQNQEQSTPVKAETVEQVMLNPPHGEPNHRCDIPVGAPLNSPPVNTTQRTTNNQIQASSSQNSNNSSSDSNNPYSPTIENAKQNNSSPTRSSASPTTGAKPHLNPPHGQPWHRCDIAVGSPLP